MSCRDDPAAAAALGDDDNRFAVFCNANSLPAVFTGFKLRFGNDGGCEDLRGIFEIDDVLSSIACRFFIVPVESRKFELVNVPIVVHSSPLVLGN